MQKPDEGTIAVDGEKVAFSSPADAIVRGIGMVHQHFMLADNLTVLENVVLGSEKLYGIGAKARRKIKELSDRYGLGVRPDVLVEELGVAARQRVEILKVLYRGARTLILDEPTAVLVPQEVDALFDNLRELKAEGLSVIFISHKLGEVLSVADEITVIRRGTTVGTAVPAETTPRQLAELMVGSELPTPRRRSPRSPTARSSPSTRCAWPRPAARPCSTTSPSPSTPVRSSASPASRATARPSWSTRSSACATPTPAPSASSTRTSPRCPPASAASRASATSPRTGTATGCSWRPPLGEPHPRPRHREAQQQGRLAGPEERPAGHPPHRRDVRRPHPRHRRHRGLAVRRQPAEADRRPRDEPQAALPDRRPPHPRRGRRRAGRDLGPHPRGPPRGPGRAADLRRPGRADRPVRHPPGDLRRQAGRGRRPGHHHPRGARLGDDRRGLRTPGRRREPRDPGRRDRLPEVRGAPASPASPESPEDEAR